MGKNRHLLKECFNFTPSMAFSKSFELVKSILKGYVRLIEANKVTTKTLSEDQCCQLM